MTNFWDAVSQAVEPAKIELEYRAYYNPATGAIVAYSTEELDCAFITITADQYAESRYSMIVKNGVLVEPVPVARKLVPTVEMTQFETDAADVSIIGAGQCWRVKEYFNE